MILDKFRRKCKENYKVESSQLCFKNQIEESEKSMTVVSWILGSFAFGQSMQEKNRILTSVHGSSTGVYLIYLFIYYVQTQKLKLLFNDLLRTILLWLRWPLREG